MNKKIEKQIIFALLIIVIILFSIAQILPWSSIEYDGTTAGTFRSWGLTFVGPVTDPFTGFYIMDFFSSLDFISEMPIEMSDEIEFLKNYAVGSMLSFVAWLLSIFAIIFSIVAFYSLYYLKEEKMKRGIFSASVVSISAFFIFYIGSNFFIMNLMNSSNGINKTNLQWSTGLILFLLGIILITGLMVFFASKKFSERMAREEESHKRAEKKE